MELHGGGMGTVLRSLGECGYGLAYRVLDAQHFGVPQRRRRVVIVGHLGDWAGPAEVLLEPEIGNGNPPQGRPSGSRPSRGTGAGADGARREVVCAIGLSGIGGIGGPDDNAAQGGHLIASTLTAREGKGPDSDATTTLVTHALTAEGSDASEDGAGRGTPLITFGHRDSVGPGGREGVAGTVRDGSGAGGGAVAGPSGVRRLTPTECERLQGFPDGWTATSYGRLQADSPRYRQLGNSIAVPVFEWVARRLVAVDQDGRR
jgi:DNA (cytosine-5)-methyltransferase 1